MIFFFGFVELLKLYWEFYYVFRLIQLMTFISYGRLSGINLLSIGKYGSKPCIK